MSEDFPILKFTDDINFWLVRANGGKYYDDFINNNYIGITYNLLTINMLKKLESDDIPITENDVRNLMFETYKKQEVPSNNLNTISKTQLTLHSKQTYFFTFSMNIGDVVLTPSKRSQKFALGIILSDPYDESRKNLIKLQREYEYHDISYRPSEYIKRRKVLWLKEVKRKDIPKELIWILNAHQAVAELKVYDKSKLFNLITPIYQYKNKNYLRIFTSKGSEFSLKDWNTLITTVDKNTKGKIDLRADINSPGYLTFLTICSKDIIEIVNSLGIPRDQLWHIVLSIGTVEELSKLFFGKENINKKGLLGCIVELVKNIYQYRSKRKENQSIKSKGKTEIAKNLDLHLVTSKPIKEKNNSKSLNLLFKDKEDPTDDKKTKS